MVQRVNMRHRAEFRADRSNRWRDMAVFYIFKMVAVRHLGFSNVRNFNCRHDSEGQFASLCQISCQWVKRFSDMAVFRFFKLAAVRHFGLVVGAYAYLGLPVADILISSVNVVSGAGVS